MDSILFDLTKGQASCFEGFLYRGVIAIQSCSKDSSEVFFNKTQYCIICKQCTHQALNKFENMLSFRLHENKSFVRNGLVIESHK